jgi:hypothetical protein
MRFNEPKAEIILSFVPYTNNFKIWIARSAPRLNKVWCLCYSLRFADQETFSLLGHEAG